MVFVGILLLSGHRPYPRQELYWSLHPNFDCPIIRKAMSKNRFMALKKYFHLNNNLEIPKNYKDRCFKIRPLIEKMKENFLQFGYFSDKYSVDEKIVGYYGRHPIKQFIRGKPVQFGFKEWALCSTSGYTYKFLCIREPMHNRDQRMFYLAQRWFWIFLRKHLLVSLFSSTISLPTWI